MTDLDEFGDDVALAQRLVDELPRLLRERTCPSGLPWTCDDPDADHGHTDCYLVRLAATEIERLRAIIAHEF